MTPIISHTPLDKVIIGVWLVMESSHSAEEQPLLKSKPSEGREVTGKGKEKEVIKVYWRRWLVLFVFISHLMGTNMAWVTVSSIADVAECYYGVNVFWINSLNYIFLIVYALFFWFATWFLQRFGLKWAAIIGGTFNAAGAWLRFAATGKLH